MSIYRQNMSDILIGADDNDTTLRPVDTSKFKNIVANCLICTEDLLVVDETQSAFAGQQKVGKPFKDQVVDTLLKDGANVDDGVTICIGMCVLSHW